MRRSRWTSTLLLSAILAAPGANAQQPAPPTVPAPAPAPPTANEVDAAKRLFDAGAQAYGAGQFTVAIQAFEQANKLVPKPAILFSLAQAQRRQYAIDKNHALLRSAIQNFRLYLQQAPDGGRRLDAAQALSDLELLESRLGNDAAALSKAPVKEPARLVVMSRTPGAMASVDGKPPKAVPLGEEVAPGKHRVRVTAPGFYSQDREPVAIENAIVPVDVDLAAQPAQIVVNAPNGADVAVDGRPMGEVGKSGDIEVPAGVRFISVTKAGHLPFAQEVELGRGERKAIDAPLRITQRRIVAYGFLGIAGVSTVLSGLFALSALGHQDDARNLRDATESRNITLDERQGYLTAIADRDHDVDRSLIALGVAGGTAAVGGLLWFFDQPSVPAPPMRRTLREPEPTPGPKREPTEIGLVPGPGLVGAGLRGRF